MRAVFEEILLHMDRGEPCMLVSAVGGEGSAPRKTQSHMLVNACERVCGMVGGGAVEGKSIAYAKELMASGISAVQLFELYEHAANDIGMICGGRVNVHFLYIRADDQKTREAVQSAAAAFTAGQNAWLMLDLGSHRLSVFDGKKISGYEVCPQLLEQLNASASACRIGDTEYYHEQLVYADRVYIFGGGHVAQALVPVLSSVGFRCVIIEDREEFCSRALFPLAQDVCLLDEAGWQSLPCMTKEDSICIMTRGHKKDLACQAFALGTQAGYIGVIGSRRKIAAVNMQLSDMGFSKEDIARIVTPIGLEIGAVTPAEIAVSIAAQMIAHRAKHRNTQKSCMS